MKKIILLMLNVFVMAACSTDDDAQMNLQPAKAKVLKAEVPDTLVMGESYIFDVFYELPSPCHADVGLVFDRGATNSEFYLYGATVYDADQVGCDQTSTDLERSGEFEVFIESQGTYIFYVWRGFDQDGKDIYEPIEREVVLE